ncbi:hypothetical protein PF003_g24340 [Phytophthora fragariae]|nr:hypothetical protein PF003_g24340 [Phytophthora fragariae]
MGKKTARYSEDQSPNLRPRQSPRNDLHFETSGEQDAHDPSMLEQAASSEQTPAGEHAQPNTTSTDATPPPALSMENMMAQVIQMMSMQQQSMLASQQRMQETIVNSQQQMHAFMVQLATFQSEMFAQKSKANQKKQRANPPKFLGKQDEDLELWIFQIEEHFAAYATERESDDSRFVNMVIPFLGPDVMSWYREFKASVGETPRTWSLFKEHIRARFRDSDFEYKLLTKINSGNPGIRKALAVPTESPSGHKLLYLPKHSNEPSGYD